MYVPYPHRSAHIDFNSIRKAFSVMKLYRYILCAESSFSQSFSIHTVFLVAKTNLHSEMKNIVDPRWMSVHYSVQKIWNCINKFDTPIWETCGKILSRTVSNSACIIEYLRVLIIFFIYVTTSRLLYSS